MWRNCRNYQWIALPLSDEGLDVRHRFRVCLVIGDGKVDHGFAEHAAHAGFRSFISDCVFEIIHIAVSRRAAANHLSQAETSSDSHEFFGYILGFGGKNIFSQPLLQIEIVGEPTKQSHWYVRVAVDEPGNDDLAGRIYDFARGVPLIKIAD